MDKNGDIFKRSYGSHSMFEMVNTAGIQQRNIRYPITSLTLRIVLGTLAPFSLQIGFIVRFPYILFTWYLIRNY